MITDCERKFRAGRNFFVGPRWAQNAEAKRTFAQRGMAYANNKGRHEAGLFVAIQTWSIPRTDRTTPAEAIVHADLDGMLVVAEAGANDLRRSCAVSGVAEVVVLVFGLCGPVRRE